MVLLAQLVTRDNKVKLERKDLPALKEELVNKVLLDRLVPRETREILEFRVQLDEMDYRDSVVCQALPDPWVHLVRMVTKENQAKLERRDSKEAKENSDLLDHREILVSEESLDLLVHPVKEDHRVTLDVVVAKEKTDLRVQEDLLVRSVTKVFQARLVARVKKETWDRRVLSVQLVLLENPAHPAPKVCKVYQAQPVQKVLKDPKEKLVTLDSQVHLVKMEYMVREVKPAPKVRRANQEFKVLQDREEWQGPKVLKVALEILASQDPMVSQVNKDPKENLERMDWMAKWVSLAILVMLVLLVRWDLQVHRVNPDQKVLPEFRALLDFLETRVTMVDQACQDLKEHLVIKEFTGLKALLDFVALLDRLVTLDLLVKQAKLAIPDKWVKLESEAKRVIVDVEVLKVTEENSVLLDGREKWEKREKPEREVFKDQSDPKANRDHLGQWARKEMTARKDCQDLKDLLVLKERKDKLDQREILDLQVLQDPPDLQENFLCYHQSSSSNVTVLLVGRSVKMTQKTIKTTATHELLVGRLMTVPRRI